MSLLALDPREAWQALPSAAWNADLARHLLRRAGWTARPQDVTRAVHEGLPATLERLFPATPPPLERPVYLVRATERVSDLQILRRNLASPEERQAFEREERELERGASAELALRWLDAAAQPARSAYEKWLFFLSDVYVVSLEKVRRAESIYRHLDILRAHGVGPAPALTKAVSRSPAMIVYLDLNRSSKSAPNENFARELFELFTLGEGHYTEEDIKQAARCFTGYRPGRAGFRLVEREVDRGEKNVFGRRGAFTGDELIDLVYEQAAAATFLPREMARYYLSDEPLPPSFFEPLGARWRASGFDLRRLCLEFFGSVAFFHPTLRATLIKSPVHYHLGLVQDLGLDLIPLERHTLLPLRQMGQTPFFPPNVRGWVGGRLWINSSTLAARRQLAQTLCSPFDEDRLNADEKLELAVARENGADRFTVDSERIRAFTVLGPAGVADRLCDYFLPGRVDAGYRDAIADYLKASEDEDDFSGRTRRAAIAVLQSPEYQLC
jgi:uncharacterized protein (DUF1800 family)